MEENKKIEIKKDNHEDKFLKSSYSKEDLIILKQLGEVAREFQKKYNDLSSLDMVSENIGTIKK